MPEPARLAAALHRATAALLAELGSAGHWTGQLSSSALSTATAMVALSAVDVVANAELIRGGLRWLAANVNADGGWGDTTESKSNISTTALCWAAFGAAKADAEFRAVVDGAAKWLDRESRAVDAGVEPANREARIVAAIVRRYGKDRTFSVPILMTLAIAGRLGPGGWRVIPKLPFELAALSHRFWGALRLPVVSYALPALIAIGQAIHHHAPTRNPFTRLARALSQGKTLRVLEALQPVNGGFLEATPLTSFVTMALASMGLAGTVVARKGAAFLSASVREDGSWPIDTNLATWTTTLAIDALARQPDALSAGQRTALRRWLLAQQWREAHPYTHAAPGGWAWTDLPGGVPDADDTPGALLALARLVAMDDATRSAGRAGVKWLLDLQNRDGGIPTFCRGWGALPFDRSSQDLTAHALRAWNEWRPYLEAAQLPRLDRATGRGLDFLQRTQRPDGAWVPLWFGNEHAPGEENPLYGTAQVVSALRELDDAGNRRAAGMAERGAEWLVRSQNDDGGWGGVRGVKSSVEETALAVRALAGTVHREAVIRGVQWLVARVESGEWRRASPIGFYFAKLWYSERLYPLIWTVAALGRVRESSGSL
jgi:squalene-hopene/tetraprenyl-beta-curcumene cyclase